MSKTFKKINYSSFNDEINEQKDSRKNASRAIRGMRQSKHSDYWEAQDNFVYDQYGVRIRNLSD